MTYSEIIDHFKILKKCTIFLVLFLYLKTIFFSARSKSSARLIEGTLKCSQLAFLRMNSNHSSNQSGNYEQNIRNHMPKLNLSLE